ncbi:Membrane bound c-di-GMP receptor LapD [hydrothermal vent metagenome]|uniref:Membrane bound c-di-GMP receptor LapD n=1 Tax=hydrothermal vent metagenome TaxID=652676 RepID=A0A3B0WF12_9ZZZZ
MSLNKQMVLFIASLLIILLIGTFALNLNSTKIFLQDQLSSHAQDTATSLGLSLSSLKEPNDFSSMETMINAVFDRGYYANITLKDTEGKLLYQRTNTQEMDNVPSFFIHAVKLTTPTAESLIQSGWIPVGTLTVTSHTGYAYIELWNSALTLLAWFTFLALLAIAIIVYALKLILAPLKELEVQAQAIVNKEYHIQELQPKTTEFREVVYAMNTMVSKLKTVFERDANTAEKLQKMAYQDPVTSLHNRRHFEMLLDSLLDPANESISGVIVLLRIHHLKSMNEKYGYITGDQFIKLLAENMQANLSHSHSIFARLNGSELIAILPATHAEQVKPQIELIAEHVPNILKRLTTEETTTSLSIAYLHYEPNQSRSTLLANLDFAINQANQLGKNQLFFYKTDQANQTSHSLWEKKLDQAFFEERFNLFQQSAYNKNREIHDQEVLVRLTDFDGIIRTAGYFMPAIEQLNRIEEIDKLVIKLSLQYLKAHPNSLPIAINLSKSVLTNPLLKNWLINTLTDFKAKASVSHLSFEMPERLILDEKGISSPLISDVKQLGIGFGIDHFGSRLTNVSYLQTLHPDYIKLDPSFSKAIIKDEQTQNYVHSLCELANSLDIKVIAMSIENEEQQKEFFNLGVEYFQGYYYGAPSALSGSNYSA